MGSTTVLDLLKSFELISGIKIKFEFLPRRDGDIATSWSDVSKASNKLDRKPEKIIKKICEDTWRWHKLNPVGYII